MEISFRTPKLAKLCNSKKEMQKRLGAERANRLAQRLQELRAVDSLDDLRTLPGARCHELTGDRKGQLAADIGHPQRLVLRPTENPPPAKPDGGLDWTAVTSVTVLDIVDYH